MGKRLLLICGCVLLLVTSATAQSRSGYWERWDVIIDNMDITSNAFDVTEEHRLRFSGAFNFGTREIPFSRVGDLTNVRVYQDGRIFQESCSEADGTVCIQRTGGNLSLRYEFFETVIDEAVDITIAYTVTDGLRSYEGGDQLWWIAVPADKPARVEESFILVNLPQGAVPREDVDPVVTYGAEAAVEVCYGANVLCNSVNVEAHVDEVGAAQVVAQGTGMFGVSSYENFEIRVQYPHNPAMSAPAWQQRDDLMRRAQELSGIVAVVIALLVGIGGPLFLFTRYYASGRDPDPGVVPEYLEAPPSDLPPAVVGALVDEKADLRDIFSTVIDLAHRGYIVFEEDRTSGIAFGIGAKTTTTLKRTNKDETALNDFEQDVLTRIFFSGKVRELEDLKNKFYSAIPGFQSQLYTLLVEYNFFRESPSTTRNRWRSIGIGLSVLAVVLFFIFNVQDEELALNAWSALFAAIFVNSIVAWILSSFMPAKTREGAIEAAKWNAFREYLSNLERYSDVQSAAAKFDDYLPYAVAFGLDKTWIRQFTRDKDVFVPIPRWYYPRHMGGPYSGGYDAGSSPPDFNVGSGGIFGGGSGGDFSLDNAAGGISSGLESISDSLTSMLNETSNVLQSQPSSSGSSGGSSGGFSGGGSSGGGGGGGSAGFG